VRPGINVEEKVIAETGDRQRVVVQTAAHAELKAGDEIRAVGQLKVGNAFDIERAFWTRQPGEKVEMKVIRQGQEVNVMVTLGANVGAGQTAAVSNETTSQPAVTASVRPATQR